MYHCSQGACLTAPIPTGSAAPPNNEFLNKVNAAPEDKKFNIVLETAQTVAAGILGLRTARHVDPDRQLMELGFDSVMAVDFVDELSKVVGQEVDATLIFDYPTMRHIATFLLEEELDFSVGGAPVAVAASPVAPATIAAPAAAVTATPDGRYAQRWALNIRSWHPSPQEWQQYAPPPPTHSPASVLPQVYCRRYP